MSKVQAFGTFYRSNDHLCRKSAYLQFGHSNCSLGSTIMLNPGEAKFIDSKTVVGNQEIFGELIPDKTMIRLVEILQQYGQTPLNGRFHIYNLFSLQNTSSKDAVKQEDWLLEARNKNVEIINQFQAEQHPWVLLAWSTEKGPTLKNLKEQWLLAIQQTKIKVFGLKAKGNHMYYHPYPRISKHRERYLHEIIQQLKKDESILI